MQDLILDGILGKELVGLDESKSELGLKFTEGTLLCYHNQECCESFVYLGKKSDKLGVVTDFKLNVTSELDKKSWKNLNKFSKDIDLASYLSLEELSIESYTLTTLTLSFMGGKNNTFKFLGVSNGYYNESVSFKWTDS